MAVEVVSLAMAGAAVGQARFVCDHHLGLALVTEGMGSFSGGSLAAEIVADLTPPFVRRATLRREPSSNVMESPGGLRLIFRAVEERIRRATEIDDYYRGMSATVAACLQTPERLLIAHVGDARVYRVTNGTIDLLTEDQVAEHPRVLTETLGGHPSAASVSERAEPIVDDDLYVLCTSQSQSVMQEEQLRRLGEAEDLRVAVGEIAAGVDRDQHVRMAIVAARVMTRAALNPDLRSERGGSSWR